MILFQELWETPILVDHETDYFGKLISLSFHTYEECLNQMLYAYVHQFEGKVVPDSELEANKGCK
jgi:hypothetical protein